MHGHQALRIVLAAAGLMVAAPVIAQDTTTETEQESAPNAVEEAFAGDAAAGEEIYQAVCRNCHGPTGKGMSAFPKLAGSEVEHLVTMLQLYRDGEKIGPNSGLMWPVAEKLTDEDITNIVFYIVDTF